MASTGFGIPARRMRMKRLAASLALAVALSLLPAQAASADTLDLTAGVFPDDQLAAQGSTGDPFAVGGGTTATGTHFAFSAHCKAATGLCDPTVTGEPAPSGYAVVSDPALGEAQGHVCAAGVQAPLAEAPFAEVAIVVEKGSGTLGSFPFLVFGAVDNGPPSGPAPDLFGIPQGLADCGFVMGFELAPVVQGNIVIKN
jgi:hypothetical protein